MPIPLLWVLGSSVLGFGAGWFSSNKQAVLIVGGLGLAAYVYVNKK
jgi:hypothetical protein